MVRYVLIFIALLGSYFSLAQSGPGGIGTTDGTSDLVLWLQSDVGITTLPNPSGTFDSVSVWNDQSGYGNHMGQNGSEPLPLLVPDRFGTGLDGIRFDGTERYLTVADNSSLDADFNGGVSIFVVLRFGTVDGSPRGIISKRNSSSSQESYSIFTHSGNDLYFDISSTGENRLRANNSNLVANRDTLISAIYDEARQYVSISSANADTDTHGGPVDNTTSSLYLGALNNNYGTYMDADVAEVIIFGTGVTQAQRIAVENYLANKYSLTLNQNDYWSDDANYSNEIAGIGQEPQFVSEATIATSSVLTISESADFGDNQFIFWGHNNDPLAWDNTDVPSGITDRLERLWLVEEAGAPGTVVVSFDPNDLPVGGAPFPTYNLLVDTDETFSNAAAYPMTLNGGRYEVAVDLNDGEYISIGYAISSPAGVTGTLAFWYDADKGVENGGNPATDGDNVTVWQDLSSNDADGQNGTSPSYSETNAINFRPVVEFDAAASEYLENSITGLEGADYTIMAVVQRASGSGAQYVFGSQNNAADAMLAGYSSNGQLDARNSSTANTNVSVNNFNDPEESPAIIAINYNSADLTLEQFRDGINDSTGTNIGDVDYAATGYTGNIGRALSGNNFDGSISELVAFSSNLSAADYNALLSNLAIQYGISLDTSYYDETGAEIFAFATAEADGYANEITALGFDASFDLDQRVATVDDTLIIATSADFTSLNNTSSRPQLGEGQFLFASHDNGSLLINQTFNGVSNSRLNRTWRVDEINSPGSITVAIPSSIGDLNFLLVSNDNSFPASSEQISLTEAGDYYYATHDFNDDEYFTFGFDDTEIWYSYKSGVWSDPNNWTLDGAVSALLVNPDNKTPLPGDTVVIKSGQRITMDLDGIVVESLEINGILDVDTTSGHNFNYIFGFGSMELAGDPSGFDNYPGGTDTLFYDVDEGGTVKFTSPNGGAVASGFGITQNRTYRNLIIEFNNNQDSVVHLTDSIKITKNLTVNTGSFKFNDDSSPNEERVLTVDGDILVEPNGSIKTGTSNARHELDLYGNFTNQGLVELTNRTSPNYGSEASNGIVDLNFISTEQDQQLSLENTTNLYRIVIDKGNDDTYVVDVTADDPSYFNLFGAANDGHPQDSQLEAESDQNENAIALYYGTLKLGQNIDVPVLNNTGNYNISEGAQLWIDGASVEKTGGQAIVPYGTIRITSGTLTVDQPSGITTRGSGTLILEGGTVTVRQFRTSIFGDTNQGGLVMSGGVLNITGGTGTNNDYTPFNLTYEGNVFNVSGGTINIEDANNKGGLFIGSNPENISATGGTINLEISSNRDFIIASRAEFYNLTMNRVSGSGEFIIDALETGPDGPGGSDNRTVSGTDLNMTIVNDLSINDTGSGTIFDANGYDVGITGTLTVQAGATMTMNSNTLTFEGEGTSFINIGTTGPLALDSLVINKDLDTDLVRITNGPNRAITIASYYNHNSGRFDYLADTVVLNGDLVVSDTIGLDTSTGELLLEGASLQTILSNGGFIYDLVLS